MTVFKRITQIVAANVNHLIEKAEDPEKMAKQLIREMDESIVRLRLEVAKLSRRRRGSHAAGMRRRARWRNGRREARRPSLPMKMPRRGRPSQRGRTPRRSTPSW